MQIKNKKYTYIIAIFILLILYFFILYPIKKDSYKGEIISKIVSSNEEYTALILEGNGGATTAYDYKVILMPTNSKSIFSRNSTIFRSYGYPVPKSVRFIAPETLEILCNDGSVFAVSFDEHTLHPNRKLKFYKGKPWDAVD